MPFRFWSPCVNDEPRYQAAENDRDKNQPHAVRTDDLCELSPFVRKPRLIVSRELMEKNIVEDLQKKSKQLCAERADYAQQDCIEDQPDTRTRNILSLFR